ncbi:hypothetical protein AUC61_03990 [Pseudomonas sp. S25]|uniref:TIGR02444 family protein n=1 Tax=Pseudomonas maioricensis TaxID=1766623 RepID=A0ABS9ZER7_9PSED|nr:TIGR02444 family protein [Pseudomonas sp. S25]MCI8208687.1 hypothetical protein [Pseudomonas sp. S25]
MPSDLWSFTLDFYARPGVEQACLSLQTSGANVCLLLCGVWLTQRGVACNAKRAREIGQLAAPWHDEVVRPLREIRTAWRNEAQHDVPLRLLREQVKALELEAERELLTRLEAQTRSWSAQQTAEQGDWLICLAGEAAGQNRDALQMLRAAMNQP